MTQEILLRDRGGILRVSVQRSADGELLVAVEGEPRRARLEALEPTSLRLTLEDTAHLIRIARVGRELHVAVDGEVHVFSAESAAAAEAHGTLASPQITSPMPGKVLRVLVEEGQEVSTGDALLILEAMKMENRMVAEASGVVRKINVSEGQTVEGGTVMMEIEYQE